MIKDSEKIDALRDIESTYEEDDLLSDELEDERLKMGNQKVEALPIPGLSRCFLHEFQQQVDKNVINLIPALDDKSEIEDILMKEGGERCMILEDSTQKYFLEDSTVASQDKVPIPVQIKKAPGQDKASAPAAPTRASERCAHLVGATVEEVAIQSAKKKKIWKVHLLPHLNIIEITLLQVFLMILFFLKLKIWGCFLIPMIIRWLM